MREVFDNDPSALALEWRGLSQKQTNTMETYSFEMGLKYPEKNRYKDVLPQDSSRVVISPTSNNEDGYVNASYLNLPQARGIGAQAPVPQAFDDFWQMIWVCLFTFL